MWRMDRCGGVPRYPASIQRVGRLPLPKVCSEVECGLVGCLFSRITSVFSRLSSTGSEVSCAELCFNC